MKDTSPASLPVEKRKSPGLWEKPGDPVFLSSGAPRPCPRGSALLWLHGQVFWLPDRPTRRAFPISVGTTLRTQDRQKLVLSASNRQIRCSRRAVRKSVALCCGFRPRSQRRVRDGFAPSSLSPCKCQVKRRGTVSQHKASSLPFTWAVNGE